MELLVTSEGRIYMTGHTINHTNMMAGCGLSDGDQNIEPALHWTYCIRRIPTLYRLTMHDRYGCLDVFDLSDGEERIVASVL